MNQQNQAGEPQLNPAQKMAAEYLAALGPRGAELFADGVSFEDASEIVIAELNEEIRRKDEQIQSLKDQGDDILPTELSKTGNNRRQL